MIINNDCLDEMRKMENNSISCIVTDPPYGLGFMGKEWDAGLPHDEIWKETLRIIKPGGHLLAFGGTRTYHRLTCAIEDAGWEIRDCLMWIYGSGFPKSYNHFGIEDYGTALKPAYEPIIMAMKPCDGTFKQNAEKWGQAGINVNACRIDEKLPFNPTTKKETTIALRSFKNCNGKGTTIKGRWPANVIFNEEAAAILDEQSGFNPSRFFYCAKASSKERNKGLEKLPYKIGGSLNATVDGDSRTGHVTIQKNYHPTVKPLKLMKYLITLVMPPKDGILLDPFAGSGSTILAAHQLGFNAVGIEKSTEYCEIARERIENWKSEIPHPNLFQKEFA